MVPTPTIILVMKYFKGKYILYLLKPMSTVGEKLHICICDTSMIHTNVCSFDVLILYLDVLVLASLQKLKKFCLFWEDGMSESIVDLDTPKIHKM